jgi:hypothetical protein
MRERMIECAFYELHWNEMTFHDIILPLLMVDYRLLPMSEYNLILQQTSLGTCLVAFPCMDDVSYILPDAMLCALLDVIYVHVPYTIPDRDFLIHLNIVFYLNYTER